MPVLTHPLPDVSAADAREILATHWKLAGTIHPLPGERERNFHVYTASGLEFVLKVASPLEDAAVIEFQVAALEHLAGVAPDAPAPRVVPSAEGTRVVAVGELTARLLTWLPGRPMAEVTPHSAEMLRSLGRSLGTITSGLSSFEHRAARRSLKWDLAAAGWIADHLDRVTDKTLRERIERVLAEFTRHVRPALADLRSSVVHNDANDYNVLVHVTADGALEPSGIIDYGDLLFSHPACDLAIAIAYAMMGKPDPITAAARVVSGYHESYPLTGEELALLFPLARTRLAVSLVNSALQADVSPDNEYLQVSAGGAARLLEHLDAIHPRMAEYRFRDACGLPPCPVSDSVTSWMAANRHRFAPLLGSVLTSDEVHVHDFSVSSLTIGALDEWRDQRRFSELVDRELALTGARAGIGRYDEVRAIYTTDLFRVEGNDGPEWRTVHVGIDVSAPPATAIHAPLDGTIHSLDRKSVV